MGAVPRLEIPGEELGGVEDALDVIERAMERDKFLSADEAKVFGLIDEVTDKRPTPVEGETLRAA